MVQFSHAYLSSFIVVSSPATPRDRPRIVVRGQRGRPVDQCLCRAKGERASCPRRIMRHSASGHPTGGYGRICQPRSETVPGEPRFSRVRPFISHT